MRTKKSLFKTNRAKLYDEDIIEVEEIDEEDPIISEETTDDDYELEEIKETNECPNEVTDEDSPSLADVLQRLDMIESRLSKLEGNVTDEDTTEEVEQNEEIVEDDDIEEDTESDDIKTEDDDDEIEEITEDCGLLDADEDIEEESAEEVTKKTDRALRTYSKFAGIKDSRKTQDKAIEEAAMTAWKKRYGITK